MNRYRVLIGIPSQSHWQADFGMSLAGMVAYAGHPVSKTGILDSVQLYNIKGSILPQLRTRLVQRALETECTHILFVDSDMVFPSDTLHRLLDRGKSVIGANCPVKSLPSKPTARQKGLTNAGELIYSNPNDGGIQRVWRVGTGVMLIDLRVFRTMPKPWFPITWNEETNDYVGEDWGFCENLDSMDIPIYIDLSLSKEIKHVGELAYSHSHVAT